MDVLDSYYTNELLTIKRIIELIFEKYDDICIRTQKKHNYIITKNTPLLKFVKKLGDDVTSKDGENYVAKIILKDSKIETNKYLAVKIIPIKKLEYNIEEVRILEILRDYMDKYRFPVFNYIYHSFICNHNNKFVYKNANIMKTIKEKEEIQAKLVICEI